jgi:SH3-like domain-containing protein
MSAVRDKNGCMIICDMTSTTRFSRDLRGPRHWALGVVLGLSASFGVAQAQGADGSPVTVVTRQAIELKSTPDSAARIVSRLPAQTRLEQLPGRFGPWIQVRTAQGAIGWLQTLDVNGARAMIAPPLQAVAPVQTPGLPFATSSAIAATAKVTTGATNPVVAAAQPVSAAPTAPAASAPTTPVLSPAAVAAENARQLFDARLAQVDTFRATSESARKFAFLSGLELATVPQVLWRAAQTDDTQPVSVLSAIPLAATTTLRSVLRDYVPVSDVVTQTYVNQLGTWLALESLQPEAMWTFCVLDSPASKSFAVQGGEGGGGGYVFVTRGLMSQLGNEAELAGILAHHISALADDGSGVGSGGGAGASMGVSSGARADRLATVLLARTGFNPQALVQAVYALSPNGSGKTFMSALLGIDNATRQRVKAVSGFIGTRFDEYPGAPNVAVTKRLAQLAAPANVAASQ